MPAPREILNLIDRFARNEDSYRSDYNETQVRVEFIDPFFKSLGWDIHNEQGFAEAFKDVIHEDEVKVSGATKAPDYSFRIGGTRKFFLEAKRPGVHLKTDPDPAFQLRRYGWSAKLPLSLLTNFAELAVYDCRVKPDKNDNASAARINYLTYQEYADKWDDLAGTFSKDAIQKGYFDKFAETKKGKRGTATVDAAFLEEIESWRDVFARNFAARNKSLDQRQLNYAVQATIDRILFLRMCEDRGIEPYGQLGKLRDDPLIYKRLFTLFQRADDRYNSGLFHFEKDPKRPDAAPDTLTPKLKLDDKPLNDILKNLYYPDSPYEFSVLPAEILGHVYEQFLGKVIRLTAGHQAKIEDKPEVKKAGGVYYTPTYIVDYIVKNTVGKLLGEPRAQATGIPGEPRSGPAILLPSPGTPGEGSGVRVFSPRDASKLRILDPACGSGSFLLGAYQYLLNWHRDWYVADDPAKHSKEIYQGAGGVWRLTSAEKKRILLNNIYGVDIDAQAVEVTKLSLLLKVLEDENEQTISSQMRLFHERALPDLASNIKCGNSLIGPDFYEGQLEMFDEEEKYRINVFDWKAEFPKIMKAGGFDAVIGNPPYVRIHRIPHAEADYVFAKYNSPTSKADLSLVFLERALQVANRSGFVGFICTSQWLATDYGKNLRRMLSDGRMHEIVDFGSLPVFEGASTYPAIFILSPTPASSLRFKRIALSDQLNNLEIEAAATTQIPLTDLSGAPWSLGRFSLVKMLNDRKLPWKPLTEFGKAYIGTKSGMASAFVFTGDRAKELGLERRLLYPYVYQGSEVERYCLIDIDAVIIYPYREGDNGAPELLSEPQLKAECPRIYEHLLSLKTELRKRRDSRRLYAAGSDWYRHLRPGSFRYIHPPKLALKGIARRSSVGLLSKDTAFDGANCPSVIVRQLSGHHLYYLLGLLNSALTSYHLCSVCPAKLSGYIRFSASYVTQVPIRLIQAKIRGERRAHDQIVELVDEMLALHKHLAAAKTPEEQARLQRQIDATDRQIDRLVYELYGLTEEEIAIVEGANQPLERRVR